jgi:hypothetical protein
MQKWLLQSIALILVMTAALNAECFASCAITSVTQPPDHACCPHHKSPHADAGQPPALPVALAFERVPQLVPAQLSLRADLHPLSISPPRQRASSITALRI